VVILVREGMWIEIVKMEAIVDRVAVEGVERAESGKRK